MDEYEQKNREELAKQTELDINIKKLDIDK